MHIQPIRSEHPQFCMFEILNVHRTSGQVVRPQTSYNIAPARTPHSARSLLGTAATHPGTCWPVERQQLDHPCAEGSVRHGKGLTRTKKKNAGMALGPKCSKNWESLGRTVQHVIRSL